MRILLLLILLAPLAAAAPGHAGDPIAENMYVHMGSAVMFLDPRAPAAPVLEAPSDGLPECGSQHVWQVPLPAGVARAAEMGNTRPKVTWYVQHVVADGASPVPLPDGLVHFAIRQGTDLSALDDGTEIAAFTDALEPEAGQADGVYRFQADLPWTKGPAMPAGPLHLEVALAFGHEECATLLPGIRAYADDAHRPSILWRLYEPVRIDVFDAEVDDHNVTLQLVASSPWGPSHIVPIDDPIILGDGLNETATLISSNENGTVERVYAWAAGSRTGSFRGDVQATDINGAWNATARALFSIRPPAPVVVESPETKDSPHVPIGLLLIGLAAGLARRR